MNSHFLNAARNGNIEQLERLLSGRILSKILLKFYINDKNKDGYTALMFASEYSNKTSSIETVRFLLDRGANINAKTNNGWTALMFASANSNKTSSIETVRLLLDRGADINSKNNYGWTALMFSSFYSNRHSSIETVRLLLDRGADPFLKNIDNESALDLCSTQECKDVINSYIWKRLYNRDKDTARRFASHMDKPKLPKDIWEIILLYKRLEQLCSNLSNEKNKEILRLFAKEYGITITKKMTKAKLYELISKQLVYGKI